MNIRLGAGQSVVVLWLVRLGFLFGLEIVCALDPTKGRSNRRTQEGYDGRVVVADRVHGVDRSVVGGVHILLCLITGEESPSAINVFVRLFPIHVADLLAINRDPIRSKASAHIRDQFFDLVSGDSEGLLSWIHFGVNVV